MWKGAAQAGGAVTVHRELSPAAWLPLEGMDGMDTGTTSDQTLAPSLISHEISVKKPNITFLIRYYHPNRDNSTLPHGVLCSVKISCGCPTIVS